MMSTTLDGAMVRSQVMAKKPTEVHIGELSGKEGSTPTSKVVAAVRGIAIKGPIQSIITVPSHAARFLFILWPKSAKESPEFTTANIPIKGSNMPVRPKAKIVIHTWLPICIPINGGNNKFPAPKNMAKSANPMVIMFVVFFNVLE